MTVGKPQVSLSPSRHSEATAPTAAEGLPHMEGQPESLAHAQGAVDQREHLGAVLRLRRAFRMGFPTVIAFFALDFIYCLMARPDALGAVLTLRLVSLLLFIPSVIRLSRPPLLEPKALRLHDLWGFQLAALMTALMCIPLGGFVSPYAGGICVVIGFRCVFVQEPWNRSLFPALLFSLWYPLAMVIGALVSDEVATQFNNPVLLARAITYESNIVALAALSVLAADSFWLLRRRSLDGQMVGSYTLGERLGSGGTGDVYIAQKRGSQVRYALKRWRPETNRLAESFVRFEREVLVLSRLRHSGTVRVLDYGMTDDGQLYYVMDLVEGRDLDSVIRERGRLEVSEALCIAKQVTRVLAVAQEAGILHRDVKPANIRLLGEKGHQAKLLDFGIARMEEGDETVTRPGAVVGTPSYIAPEQLTLGQIDRRSDVYSLAATLYHALVGCPPYGRLNLTELIGRVLQGDSATLGEASPHNIPIELESLIERALSLEPDKRPANCAELLQELEAIPLKCTC